MKSAMHPDAREEFLAAIDYYNEAEPGLGMAFYSEVEAAIGLIENYPDLWTEIDDNIRRCLVRRFPFAVLYSKEAGRVFIYAIMHTKREPNYWRDRLNS
jgi:hypothetical protein